MFQLARRINTALYRRIVFNEWAPVVIGRNINEHLDNVDINLSSYAVSNEYATAASRFYFSMMPGDLLLNVETMATNQIQNEEYINTH